jgi:uncharacterized membrane protein
MGSAKTEKIELYDKKKKIVVVSGRFKGKFVEKKNMVGEETSRNTNCDVGKSGEKFPISGILGWRV